MARWKVTPTWKKSIIETQIWEKEGIPGYIEYQIGWRWGEFFIDTESEDPPEIDEDTDLFGELNCEDWSTDDACWEETEVDLGGEGENEKWEEFLENNSVFDLSDEGWEMTECSMRIECDVEIEKVEE